MYDFLTDGSVGVSSEYWTVILLVMCTDLLLLHTVLYRSM